MMTRRGSWLLVLLAACKHTGQSGPDGGADAQVADAQTRDGQVSDAGGDGGAGTPTWSSASYPWPMFGHDPRRTARSPLNGPQTYSAASTRNWSYAATAGASINMQPVVTAAGVFFGTWGILRRNQAVTPDNWIKEDGKYWGLHLDGRASPAAQQLFTPVDPHPTASCYQYLARPHQTRDDTFCGTANPFVVSFYNGTIEGTPLSDPDSGVQYVGRGDGALYALDPSSGAVLWRFATFNPMDPADPDGGGEIIGGALMGPGKRIYFATFGTPWPVTASEPGYETHAVYAVDTAGHLVWRYPAAAARADNPFLAAPALSPDGRTLYVATWFADGAKPGRLLALDLGQPAGASDAQRLKWELVLNNPAHAGSPSIWVRHLSVGADGTIYVAGAEAKIAGTVPVVMAVRDDGTAGHATWTPTVIEPQGYPISAAAFVQGLALWEDAGGTRRIYASTSHLRTNNGTGGKLFVLDAATGATLASFDPETLATPGIGGLTAPTLGNDETVYVGSRGRHDLLVPPTTSTSQWRPGWMYALRFSGSQLDVRWSKQLAGQLDWAHPAIGPGGALYFGSTDSFSPVDQNTWYDLTQVPPFHSPVMNALFE